MTRATRSFIFTIATSILNIAMTLTIILLLLGLFFLPFILSGNPPSTDSYIIQAGLPILFILGLVISLKLFVMVAAGIIKLFHLEDKLDPKIIKRYSKENRL